MATFGSSAQTKTSANDTPTEQIYLKLVGERLIRILDEEETVFWRYFMPVRIGDKRTGRSIVVGPGDTPIKKYMERIGDGHDDFRKVQKRLLLNVLDRTPVNITSEGVIYPEMVGFRSDTAVPHNKVMIIEFGNDLMTQFITYHNRVRDQKTFEPLPVWAFDIRIVTKTNPKDRLDVKRTAMADLDQSPLPADLKALPKYDLSLITRPFPVEYQQRLLDGEDYVELIKELGWERPVATVSQ